MNETAWQRSSYCNNGQCLEVSRTDHHVLLRDSKDPSGRTLALTLDEFAAFLAGAKAGEFDGMAPASPVSGVPATHPGAPETNASRDSVRE